MVFSDFKLLFESYNNTKLTCSFYTQRQESSFKVGASHFHLGGVSMFYLKVIIIIVLMRFQIITKEFGVVLSLTGLEP